VVKSLAVFEQLMAFVITMFMSNFDLFFNPQRLFPMKEKVIRHRAYESLDCPVEVTTEIIGGKWKGKIVYILLSGKKRFGELRRLVGTATHRMLTTQLRQLERDGVVQRTVYLEAPPKVEYSLTRLGQKLKPVIETLWQWGKIVLDKSENDSEKI
jgi:DNA-binding HxlR family transcriptional regulator